MKVVAILLFFFLTGVAGCSGSQSALDVHGAPAIHLKDLMTAFVWICGFVWLLVIFALIYALVRSRTGDASTQPDGPWTKIVVSGAVAATGVIITGLTIASFYTTRAIDGSQGDAISISLKGEQWWWRIRYPNRDPALEFETANEIHIPVGRDVRLQLESADVIHSFWVPSLAGKQDLVPGRSNTLLIRAERPGIYRGQCAEFCGLQHSHMGILVVADDEASYARWLASQRKVQSQTMDPEASAGEKVFLAKPCAACHTVRGRSSTGTTGPDLTHVGSRQTIGAGLLETTPGSLAAWIADPQTLKPGNNMPMVPLTSNELRQISRYMDSLR
ncbi:cytochrome c oxidase subunit II [Pararhizobium sp. DWP3-4]|uniref:cytochrome c oxidase subunit II n=1 Tax=Pararhizobium sp. DWP3-4 TaxID=2804565 RepID=UPI003CEBB11A